MKTIKAPNRYVYGINDARTSNQLLGGYAHASGYFGFFYIKNLWIYNLEIPAWKKIVHHISLVDYFLISSDYTMYNHFFLFLRTGIQLHAGHF